LRNCKSFCFGLAAVLVLASAPARAQMYSWKDPATGQCKLSNLAPPWYNRGEVVGGPRVIATAGGQVIDDTALPYAERLLLLGKPKEQAGTPRPERKQESAMVPEPMRKAAAIPVTGLPPQD